MNDNIKVKKEVFRIKGRLKELLIIKDKEGNVLHKVLSPLMVEFHPRDVVQVIIGAALLSIPISYTEEAWRLGETMPLLNIFILMCISVLFVALFVYYNFYRHELSQHWFEFLKRSIFTYILAAGVAATILTIIGQTPWETDLLLVYKRIVIVAFPASLSATLADTIK